MGLIDKHKYPFVSQNDSEDCSVACVTMIFRFLVGHISYQTIDRLCQLSNEGLSLRGLLHILNRLGLDASAFYATDSYFLTSLNKPLIALINGNHFVVIYKSYSKKGIRYVKVADPKFGINDWNLSSFINVWKSNQNKGILIKAESTNESIKHIEKPKSTLGKIKIITEQLVKNKYNLLYLTLMLFVILVIQLILPFLTQNIVDKGINVNRLDFVELILIAQMCLIVSKCLMDICRAQITIYLSSKISIELISAYLEKLFKLPLTFFVRRKLGDLIQRMEDHSRIVSFLSTDSVSISISLIGFVVSGSVLIYYSTYIFLIYSIAIILYALWTSLFLGIRKRLDYEYFLQRSKQTSSMYQLFDGIEEIKLQGCSKRKSREFKEIYESGLQLGIKRLSIFQINRVGATFINQGRDVIITVITSLLVIRGELTLGVLLAVQYVIGQLDSPVDQIVNFIYKLQDLSIAIQRINTIYTEKEEVKSDSKCLDLKNSDRNIYINNVSYKYNVYDKDNILDNISFVIPQGKMTAIVGLSGSGKTTLLKLLLGYDYPTKGEILIGKQNITNINIEDWRKNCGVVMQDGYVFADTIENNIAIADDVDVDSTMLEDVAKKSCIDDIIKKTPQSFKTIIGKDGRRLSKGQKQRILISRIMYKNPKFVFLDEATNSLDSQTEFCITNNLQSFFTGKTVLVIAHRMSTIRKADNIIVLENGHIVEEGKHEQLMSRKGKYYNLVINQI